MKCFRVTIISLILLLSLSACEGAPGVQTREETVVSDETVVEIYQNTQSSVETVHLDTEKVDEGFLYLNVSKIDFSVIGESEDLYIGTIPRENVIWVSEDENVVTFENGIACATGVGTTTIYAEYNGNRVMCQAGCLARNEEELAQLSAATLRAPKRLPPEVSDTPLTFFDDSAMVGDSITYVMSQYQKKSGYLGTPKFLCRGSSSVNGFVKQFHEIYFRGAQMHLEDAIAKSGVRKVYFMLGQNDIGYQSPQVIAENWKLLMDRIWEKTPDVEIYIQSCTPGWMENGAGNGRNELVDELNALMKDAAQTQGFHYLELAAYLEDHENKLATEYCSDKDVHMNELGSNMWMRVLKAHAEYQMLLQSHS